MDAQENILEPPSVAGHLVDGYHDSYRPIEREEGSCYGPVKAGARYQQNKGWSGQG